MIIKHGDGKIAEIYEEEMEEKKASEKYEKVTKEVKVEEEKKVNN